MIQVLFFGPVADRVQARELQLEHVAGMRLQDVMTQLRDRYPGALDIVSFTAVNQVQVDDGHSPIADGDEIAIMAKFSGG